MRGGWEESNKVVEASGCDLHAERAHISRPNLSCTFTHTAPQKQGRNLNRQEIGQSGCCMSLSTLLPLRRIEASPLRPAGRPWLA
jgi:hypothetical protein